MNPEISNLMMQGYTKAEAEAEIKSWQIIPEPLCIVLAKDSYIYHNGVAHHDWKLDLSGDYATANGFPCYILRPTSHGEYTMDPDFDMDSVADARQLLFETLSERNRQFRSERYEVGELEMRVYPNSPPEMHAALAAAKTALDRGNEFEVQSALANLRAAVNPPVTELVRVPLSEGKQAIEDETTAAMLKALARREEFTAPPLPEPTYAEASTKEECHECFINDVIMRANSKYRGPDMLKCICHQFDCPHKYGFGRRNPDWKITPQEFTTLEEAAEQMRELTKQAEEANTPHRAGEQI